MREDIVCIAPNTWTDLWRRRQQLMSRFARRGMRVLYIEPPRSVVTPFVDRRLYGYPLHWDFGLRKETEGVWVYSPPLPLPLSRFPTVARLNELFLFSSIRKVIKKLEMPRPILWVYYTFMVEALIRVIESVTTPRLFCYDCYDYYAGYAGVRPSEKPRVVVEERELVQKADMVFVVSEPLYADKKPFNPNTFLVPNGVDMVLYEAAGSLPADIALIPHPIVGFTGMIAGNKVDVGSIRYLVESRPEWSVVLVGPVFPDLQRVIAGWPKHENLHWLGEKAPWELPAYVSAFDVCIAPYLDNQQLSYVRAPLKIYEYLAAGKPVVGTGFVPSPEVGNLVRIAKTPDEFINQIEKCLIEDNMALAQQRIEVACQNSWDLRVEQLLELVGARLRD